MIVAGVAVREQATIDTLIDHCLSIQLPDPLVRLVQSSPLLRIIQGRRLDPVDLVTLREISEVGRRAPLHLYHTLVGCDPRFLLASDEKLARIVGPIHVLRLVVGLSDSLVRQATARLAGI